MSLSLDRSNRERASFTNLQRIDPSIVEVLGSASHVTMYIFDTSTHKWQRHEVEGPLFVVKRGDAPRFRLVILNRLSRNNETYDVTNNFHIQLIEPYLIFKSQGKVPGAEPQIYGVWFPDNGERSAVFSLLQRLVASQKTVESDGDSMFSQPTPKQPPAPAPVRDPAPAATPLAAPTPIAPPAASPRGSAVRPSSRPGSTSPPPGISSPRMGTPEPASGQAAPAPTVPLLTPGMILGDANVSKLTGRSKNAAPSDDVPMDKEALRLALMSLVEDDTFLDLFHQKYSQALGK